MNVQQLMSHVVVDSRQSRHNRYFPNEFNGIESHCGTILTMTSYKLEDLCINFDVNETSSNGILMKWITSHRKILHSVLNNVFKDAQPK